MEQDHQELYDIAQRMLAKGKGILAADESNRSATKRLDAVGLESTPDTRRQYRELFLGMEGIENYISGVILYDETLRQSMSTGVPFLEFLNKKGIVPGIKVDQGLMPFGDDGEHVTQGLDGLMDRLAEYVSMGAQFTKWRALITISDLLPTEAAIAENARILAQYAKMVQESGMVPMVEPEVLLRGNHSIDRAEEVTTAVVKKVFEEIALIGADMGAVILKTSMVLPGSESGQSATAAEIAEATVRMLHAAVPQEVPGVVFLSGGQSPAEARDNLNAIAQHEPLPWEIAFSYARALQGPALEAWQGNPANVPIARAEFKKWLEFDVAADAGSYQEELED